MNCAACELPEVFARTAGCPVSTCPLRPVFRIPLVYDEDDFPDDDDAE